MKIGFKVIFGYSAENLENKLNNWIDTLPLNIKIRRTQLAAVINQSRELFSDTESLALYALINYEINDGEI